MMSDTEYEYIKCKSCLGVGQRMGLGSIYKDCLECDKVGYIKQAKVEDDLDYLAARQNAKSVEEVMDDHDSKEEINIHLHEDELLYIKDHHDEEDSDEDKEEPIQECRNDYLDVDSSVSDVVVHGIDVHTDGVANPGKRRGRPKSVKVG